MIIIGFLIIILIVYVLIKSGNGSSSNTTARASSQADSNKSNCADKSAQTAQSWTGNPPLPEAQAFCDRIYDNEAVHKVADVLTERTRTFLVRRMDTTRQNIDTGHNDISMFESGIRTDWFLGEIHDPSLIIDFANFNLQSFTDHDKLVGMALALSKLVTKNLQAEKPPEWARVELSCDGRLYGGYDQPYHAILRLSWAIQQNKYIEL